MEEVISDVQRALNANLHKKDSNYGNRTDGAGLARNLAKALARLHELGACDSILDYGTGKGALVEQLKSDLPKSIKVDGYDPAVKQYAKRPEDAYDIVISLDVLEHIELKSIDSVLKEIHKLTKNFCYLVIDLQPAVKKLADGRNAHILLAPADWWVNKLSAIFPCVATFPIMHKSGEPQKIVIAACHQPKLNTLMYSFLIKLDIFSMHLTGGVLQGMIDLQNKLKKVK